MDEDLPGVTYGHERKSAYRVVGYLYHALQEQIPSPCRWGLRMYYSSQRTAISAAETTTQMSCAASDPHPKRPVS